MPSASCCFLHVFLHSRKSISNGVQTQQNFLWSFYGPEDTQWAGEAPGGCLEGGTTHQGAPGSLGAPWWFLPTSGAPRTASLLYKCPPDQLDLFILQWKVLGTLSHFHWWDGYTSQNVFISSFLRFELWHHYKSLLPFA